MRYPLKFYNGRLQLIIRDIRCSTFSSASDRTSDRTQSVSVLKTNHGNRSLMHVRLQVKRLFMFARF